MSTLRRIDETRLENDLGYRFGYLTEFMEFSADDIATIHALAPHLAPLVPALVDAVYVKLFRYDATKRHFVPRQAGYEGPLPDSVETLAVDHEQIKFRKGHLATYLTKLVTAPYDGRMVGYLDFVGKMHTPKAGNPMLDVPLVQMNALMGYVSDALVSVLLSLDIDCESKKKAVRAFNKLLWLQNDLITRHYQAESPAAARLSRKPERTYA
jgi:hypothetical protein